MHDDDDDRVDDGIVVDNDQMICVRVLYMFKANVTSNKPT